MAVILDENHFGQLLAFIKRNTGIRMPDVNYATVKREVARRMERLGLDFRGYLKQLESDDEERFTLYNLITINETYLFREEKQFCLLRDFVFPQLAKGGRDITIWSVTCSTGEEAISLALASEEYFKEPYGLGFKVVGSDISRSALARFAEGSYSANSFRKDGLDFHILAERYGSYEGKSWRIGEELRKGISLFHLNLFQDHYEDIPLCDLIFFRNTLIYMEKEERDHILDKVVERLKVGGYIFLSLNETHLLEHTELELRSYKGIYYFYKSGEAPDRPVESGESEIKMELKVERSREEETGGAPFELAEIVRLAGDEAALKESDKSRLNSKLARTILEGLDLIYRCRFDEAARTIRLLENEMGESELSCYLRALSDYHRDTNSRGEELFNQAVYYNNLFWPAYYYLGKIHQESAPRKSLREISRCKTLLERELERGVHPYSFLLEGFSEKYFYDMAVKMVERMR